MTATLPSASSTNSSGSPADHLWMHFTRMGSYDEQHPVPIIERGEGCYIWDTNGKRYLDALSGLFVVQAGHGREELARPPPRRPASWPSSRSGRMRTPPRSNWRTGSRPPLPAT